MSVALHETRRRQLTDRQVEAIDLLIHATEAEVDETGYDGLSVRGVARRAGVAPATAYTYFSSKDHLLAELLWRRVRGVGETVVDPSGSTADRLGAAVADLGEITSGSPAVVAACTQALLSSHGDVKALREHIGVDIRRRLAAAAGSDRDRRIVDVLVTTYFGALLSAGMGHMAYVDVPEFVVAAARLMSSDA
ncbi:MAG: TetR/AcrR family transcriptional regulator [Actinomycetes bacterium]